MKLEFAEKLIRDTGGYRVMFTNHDAEKPYPDEFPEMGEPPFRSAQKAWDYAMKFYDLHLSCYKNIQVGDYGCTPLTIPCDSPKAVNLRRNGIIDVNKYYYKS